MKFKKNYLEWLFVILLILLPSLFFDLSLGDGEAFKSISLEADNLLNFSVSRYKTWSSRQIIDLVVVVSLHLPKIIWCFIHTIVVAVTMFLTKYLIQGGGGISSTNKYSVLAMYCLFPIWDMCTAGWIPTFGNYWYPFTAALIIISLLIRHYQKKNPTQNKSKTIFSYVFLIVLTAYASNVELVTVIIFICCMAFFLYYVVYLHRKYNLKLYIVICVNIMSLFYILTCSGNYRRKILEADSWFKNFEMLTIFEKIRLGIIAIFKYLLYEPNTLFFLFSFFLFMCLCLKKEITHLCRFIGSIPLIFSSFFFLIRNISTWPLNANINYSEVMEYYLNYNGSDSLIYYAIVFCTLLVLICIIYAIFTIYEYDTITFRLIFLFCLCILTCFIMGFSPTIFASSTRIFFYINLFLVIGLISLVEKLNDFILNPAILQFARSAEIVGCSILYLFQIFFVAVGIHG